MTDLRNKSLTLAVSRARKPEQGVGCRASAPLRCSARSRAQEHGVARPLTGLLSALWYAYAASVEGTCFKYVRISALTRSISPQLSQDGPSQGPRPRRLPEALTAPLLSGMSRPRSAAPRLAAHHSGRSRRRAGGAASAASEQRPSAQAGSGEGEAKRPLVFPIRLTSHRREGVVELVGTTLLQDV
jgi:hypothetical protein